MITKEEIQNFLKESVNTLLTTEYTCCRLELDERLAVYVGWSSGYGEELRNDCIQNSKCPDWAINAGIKVHTSDYMQTDYDWINFPYYASGDVWDNGLSLTSGDKEENYEKVADWFIRQYKILKKLNISEEGEIISGTNN